MDPITRSSHVPEQGPREAGGPTAPLETDLLPGEFIDLHAGALEPRPGLGITGNHHRATGRDGEHIAAERLELRAGHLDQLDATREQGLAERHRQKRRVDEPEVLVDGAHDRHQVKHVFRTAPVGQGYDDQVVHHIRQEHPQLPDALVVGAVAAPDHECLLVDPAYIAAFERAGAADPPVNRQASRSKEGFLRARLGAPLRLAHATEDDPPLAHERRIANVQGVESHRGVGRQARHLDTRLREQRQKALGLVLGGGEVRRGRVPEVAPLPLDEGVGSKGIVRAFHRDAAEPAGVRLSSDYPRHRWPSREGRSKFIPVPAPCHSIEETLMTNRSIDRRSFVEYLAVSGAVAMSRPSFPRFPGLAPGVSEAAPPFELEEVTVSALQAGMTSGKYTAKGLATAYLQRIDELDKKGPALRAVLETNPDALAQATALDAERKAKGPRGPLHGIPVLVKDNVATKDRMQSTAGSLALVGVTPPRDAFIVDRLRAAGAVILGKANLSEWANFRSTHSSSGWSGRGGQCRNPYALDRTPSGSSSGSGVAVSANLCAVAIGTETDGSIVSPSTCCGIVGIKPTLGLVSRSGIIPIAHSQDTAGPMARSVKDAALLLEVLAGRDPADAATRAKGAKFDVRYSAALDRGALKGARIGVARNKYFGYHPATDALAEEALKVLKAEGAVLVDPANIATAGKIDEPELEVLLYEFKADLEAYLSKLGGSGPRTMKALIEWNQAHADTEMPLFGQELFLDAEKKGPLTSAAYRKARDACIRLSRKEGIDATLSKHKLDAIVAPT